MPSPHVGDEKDKRAIVYKTKEKRRKGIEKRKIIRARLKKLMAENYAHSFSCFTLKSNILAQDSDQLSLPHSINSLFGSFGLRSIPILDPSQIWSLHLKNEIRLFSIVFILVHNFLYLG